MSAIGKILIVEDEKNLGDTLSEFLRSLGHTCVLATNCKCARVEFKALKPNIILMDIGLPDGNGLELAKELQNQSNDFVLLFLSALNDPDTRVTGLELGAQDYITKPFALKELVLRLDRIMANIPTGSNVSKSSVKKHGSLSLSFEQFQLINAQNEVIKLNNKECQILKLLYENKNIAISRESIIEKVWGTDKFPSNRTVDNYIVKFRKWADTDPNKSLTIESIHGVGYKLTIKN